MITSRIASEVTAKKSLDHRIHLVGNFELVEMPGAHSAAINEILQPLRDQRRRDALRRCCQMQRRHFAQCRSGLTIELENTPDGTGGDVRRRGQHHSHYLLHELPVGVWQEHAFDPLPAGPVIASLDAACHRLNGAASIWRMSKRRVDHDDGADAGGMGSSQLQDDHATHAVADRHNLTEALLFNDVSEIVGISRDRVWSGGLVALAMSAQIYGNDAMLAGEVLGLRGEEFLALRYENIDFDGPEPTIHIRESVVGKDIQPTKTSASEAKLPMCDGIGAALLYYREEYPPIAGWVFGSATTQRPFWLGITGKRHLLPALYRMAAHFNLKEIPRGTGFHAFRHTYRALMDSLNSPLEVQQRLMRHADPALAGRSPTLRRAVVLTPPEQPMQSVPFSSLSRLRKYLDFSKPPGNAAAPVSPLSSSMVKTNSSGP